MQDPPQHGPQGEPPEDSIEDLFADLPSEEKEPWTPIEIQAWDAMNRRWQDKVAETEECQGDIIDIRDSYAQPPQS